jgi:hypothetical protein
MHDRAVTVDENCLKRFPEASKLRQRQRLGQGQLDSQPDSRI